MTLQWYLLEADHDPGTAAETINRDLPRAGITKALIFNMPALSESTAGQTVQQLGAQLDQIRIGAVESNRVSEIDGEDLFNWNVVNDNHPFVNTSTTDNAVVQIGMTYALDPFCIGSYADYNQKFCISANDIQQQAIAINRKDVAGPIYPDMCKDFTGQYELGSIGDEGYWFWNFGIRNEVGAIGRPTQDKMEIRSLGGSDAGAVRVYAARLNNNT